MALDFSDLGPSTSTPSQGGKLDFSDLGPGPSWSDVPKNALNDVGGLAKAGVRAIKSVVDPADIVESAMAGSMQPTKDYISKGHEVLSQIPKTIIKDVKDTVMHPIDTFKRHPVNTALNVAGALELGGAGVSALRGAGEAPEIASSASSVADDIGRAAPKSPEPMNVGNEAADILKQSPEPKAPNINQETPTVTSASSSSVDDILSSLGNKAKTAIKGPLDEVSDFLGQRYAKASSKPGFANTMADYLKEHSQNMGLKELGASPGQVRKIGVDRAHALSDYALDNGLAGTKIGTIGRERLIPQRLNEAGGAIGAFRKMASDRGAVHNIDDLVNSVRGELDSKYLKGGMYSGEKGLYQKALQELEKSGPRAEDISDKVSEMFQQAKKLDKLKNASGPLADVARTTRSINHDLISKHLTPEELALYERGLEDYGALTQINEFVKRRASTDAGGRLGPGSGISRAAVQKFLDSVGYRTEAHVMRRLADVVRKNPEIATRPKDLFRHYADEAVEAVDEMGDAVQ